MANSRKEKSEVVKNADWGAWFLLIIVVIIGVLAYNYEYIGERWTKVLEIVGAPFSLGLGFFAFKKASEMLNEYKESNKGDE
ncbi:TPA: hypothetical protein VJK63_001847 [Streptococcus pyogenes]|nr:hypothetical protein [Streptococcus pyogenes]